MELGCWQRGRPLPEVWEDSHQKSLAAGRKKKISLRPIGLRVNIWYLARSWLERNTRERERRKNRSFPS